MMKKALCYILLFSLSSCSGLFFFPSREQFIDPAKYGLTHQEVSFSSHDGTHLSGWMFPSKTAEVKGTVIQFHGNAENMTSHFQSLVWLVYHGYNLFTFDYRGYGTSEGEPTIPGVNLDAQAAYAHIIQSPEAGNTPIILYGQSLGGLILLKALEKFPDRSKISMIIVEGSFLSYQEIAREKMNNIWLTWPFQHLAYLFFSDEYAAMESIKKISPIPLLVIHGNQDNVIPYEFGQEIYNSAKHPKSFWSIKEGNHIDTMLRHGGIYRNKLVKYLDKNKSKSTSGHKQRKHVNPGNHSGRERFERYSSNFSR